MVLWCFLVEGCCRCVTNLKSEELIEANLAIIIVDLMNRDQTRS